MTRLIHDSKVLRGQSPYHEKWCKVVERANLSLGILRKSQFKSPLTTCELLILKALYIYIYRCKSVSQAASHSPCIYIYILWGIWGGRIWKRDYHGMMGQHMGFPARLKSVVGPLNRHMSWWKISVDSWHSGETCRLVFKQMLFDDLPKKYLKCLHLWI